MPSGAIFARARHGGRRFQEAPRDVMLQHRALEKLRGEIDMPIDLELYRTIAYLSQIAPTYSLRGGTREILRGMIARGLGLR